MFCLCITGWNSVAGTVFVLLVCSYVCAIVEKMCSWRQQTYWRRCTTLPDVKAHHNLARCRLFKGQFRRVRYKQGHQTQRDKKRGRAARFAFPLPVLPCGPGLSVSARGGPSAERGQSAPAPPPEVPEPAHDDPLVSTSNKPALQDSTRVSAK